MTRARKIAAAMFAGLGAAAAAPFVALALGPAIERALADLGDLDYDRDRLAREQRNKTAREAQQ